MTKVRLMDSGLSLSIVEHRDDWDMGDLIRVFNCAVLAIGVEQEVITEEAIRYYRTKQKLLDNE